MRKLIVIVAVAAAAIAVAVVPLAAFADDDGDDDAATIGVRLDFSSPTHAEGSFAVCCSVTDSGTAVADVTSYVEQGDQARFEATNTYTGAKGELTILLTRHDRSARQPGPRGPRSLARDRGQRRLCRARGEGPVHRRHEPGEWSPYRRLRGRARARRRCDDDD